MHHRKSAATHGLIVLTAVLLLLRSSAGVFAFVARVTAGPPAAAATAAASLFKVNPETQASIAPGKRLWTMSALPYAQPSSSAEVIVVGSCNTDLVTYTPRLPQRGECSLLHLTPFLLSPRTGTNPLSLWCGMVCYTRTIWHTCSCSYLGGTRHSSLNYPHYVSVTPPRVAYIETSCCCCCIPVCTAQHEAPHSRTRVCYLYPRYT